MTSPLRQLVTLITEAADKLERAVDKTKTSIPDLNSLFAPQSEAFRIDPDVAESANIICAAASQLEAILLPPHVSLGAATTGYLKSAAVRLCLESNVTEILREAGPDGLHVDEIATKNGQNPQKLARMLRFLATHHIYREIKPDVFTNTRISSLLDTLKPSQDIIDHPETKYENTRGMAALISHVLDEMLKSSAYVWETLSDPVAVSSGGMAAVPFSRAFNTKESFWEVLSREEFRYRRFNIAMEGVRAMQPSDAILKAYDWSQLPTESIIVDVGGGVGSESLILAREFPSFNLVVQDLAPVIEAAKKHWQQNLPNAQVKFEVQDFFTPQPAGRHVTVFLLKQILHDWSDKDSIKILTQLRAVAETDTKLLLVESLLPLACHDPNNGVDALEFPGSTVPEAPAPLLANFGIVNLLGYTTDLNMFLLFDAQERTIRHFNQLLSRTGWKIRKVYRQSGDSTFLQSVEAIPV
ncbi:hypothetical protein C0989_010597 [Termitomyces sp. Mn162]|nr:hypothetical protein C0989_010597 [Termitomyces sp. Mn162]